MKEDTLNAVPYTSPPSAKNKIWIPILVVIICIGTICGSIVFLIAPNLQNNISIQYGNITFTNMVTEELDSYGENVVATSWISTLSKINESRKKGSNYKATDIKTFMTTDNNGNPLYINCAKLDMPFSHKNGYVLATINGHNIYEFFDYNTFQTWGCLEYDGGYILIDPVQKAMDSSNIKDYQSFIEGFIYNID